jgi:hypothetical protein
MLKARPAAVTNRLLESLPHPHQPCCFHKPSVRASQLAAAIQPLPCTNARNTHASVALRAMQHQRAHAHHPCPRTTAPHARRAPSASSSTRARCSPTCPARETTGRTASTSTGRSTAARSRSSCAARRSSATACRASCSRTRSAAARAVASGATCSACSRRATAVQHLDACVRQLMWCRSLGSYLLDVLDARHRCAALLCVTPRCASLRAPGTLRIAAEALQPLCHLARLPLVTACQQQEGDPPLTAMGLCTTYRKQADCTRV